MRRRIKNEKGIGLIETILAIGIAIVVITSMVSLSLFTLRASLQNKLALSGTQLVNDELEQVRAYRDANTWDTFVTQMDASGCFASVCNMSSPSTIVSSEEIIDAGTTSEIRKSFILIDQSGGARTLIRVAASASWEIGPDTKYANNYTDLSNWREY